MEVTHGTDSSAESKEPLIITLMLDEDSHLYFNNLRLEHFPKKINYLNAHLTLFHHLPPGNRDIDDALRSASNRRGFVMQVLPPVHSGFGVAFPIESPDLLQLRKVLAESFVHWLIPQDKQKFQPHITVQNKVGAVESKALAAELKADFQPRSVTAEGFSCYRYMQGPWEHLKNYPFLSSL